MQITHRQLSIMLWRRIEYFYRARHLSTYAMSKVCMMSYRSFSNSRSHMRLMRLDKLIMLSDALGINLDELCDPRIPVTNVEITPLKIKKGWEKLFSPEKIAIARELSLKDSRRMLSEAGIDVPSIPLE